MRKIGYLAGLAASLVFAAAFQLPEAVARPLDAHTQMAESVRRACDATCSSGSLACGISIEHKVDAGGSNATSGYGLHGCLNLSTGCGYHGCAQTSISPDVDLHRLVAESDLQGIADAVGETNRVYVPEREVLQILADCGKVLAQVPLSPSRARALALD